MARFVKHSPCPSCGSRDNLAEYDDGSAFCFGCRYTRRRNKVPKEFLQQVEEQDEEQLSLPRDSCGDFSQEAVAWLTKDGIRMEEVLRAGAVYSPYFNQVLFPYYDQEGKLALIQARNFNKGKPKYYNKGSNLEVLPIQKQEKTSTIVITEDLLSAIKVTRVVNAVPALGTNFPARKIYGLIKQGYTRAVIWLDRDKFREAMEIADSFKWVGLSARVIKTDEDPKTYDDDVIRRMVE